MVSTYSSRYKFEKPALTDYPGTWGNNVNTSITDLVDGSIDAVSAVAMADANATLTIPDGTSSPNRAGTLVLTGAHTAIRTLTVPAGDRILRVVNATTGGFNVLVKSPSSSTISVFPGYMATIYFIGAGAVEPGYQISSALITTATVVSMSAGFTDGTVGAPSIAFSADSNTGFYRVTADQIGVSTGGVQRALFASSLQSSFTDFTISKANPVLTLTSPTASSRRILWETNGVPRWLMQVSSAAETGSDAGSDWSLGRYDDAGALLATAISMSRATGTLGINGSSVAGVRQTITTTVAEGIADARSLRLLNLSSGADFSAMLEFATSGSGGTLRGRIRGKREGGTDHGTLILSSALSGVGVDVLSLSSSAAATFTGAVAGVSFTPTSDARLKSEIVKIDDPLDRLEAVSGVTFYKAGANCRNGKPLRMAGVIAQDARVALPEAAVETEIDAGDDGPGIMAVDPMALIGLLIEAVKALRAEVATLKSGSL